MLHAARGEDQLADELVRDALGLADVGEEKLHQHMIQCFRDMQKIDRLELANELVELANYMMKKSEYTAADSVLRECLTLQVEAFGSKHRRTARTAACYGRCRLALGDKHQALVLLSDSYPILAECYDSGHPFVRHARLTLSDLGGPISSSSALP